MLVSKAADILELKAPFTALQAKVAYRRMSVKFHPDKGGSLEKMKLVNEAYEACSKGVAFGSCPKIDLSGVKFKTILRKPKLSNVVRWFCNQMLTKLMVHQRKGFSWRKEPANLLFSKLVRECTELRAAITEKDKKEIIKECADVANFAMMIADNARNKL